MIDIKTILDIVIGVIMIVGLIAAAVGLYAISLEGEQVRSGYYDKDEAIEND